MTVTRAEPKVPVILAIAATNDEATSRLTTSTPVKVYLKRLRIILVTAAIIPAEEPSRRREILKW